MLASTNMLAMIVTAFVVGKVAKGKGAGIRNGFLIVGFLMLLAANILLAAPAAANAAGMFFACACIGVHMGMTHGLTLSMLSSYMPHKDVPGALPKSGPLRAPCCHVASSNRKTAIACV
jgi:MFS family permease